MANFDVFLPMLLKFEGGFVNDPDDPGGATNKGVTMKTFQIKAKRLLGIEPTLENLKALTDQQAGIIYKQQYWDKVGGDAIASQNLANIVCDFYVNAGGHASTLLQSVMNDCGADPQLVVDGGIGPHTLQSLAGMDQDAVYAAYKQGRADYYRHLVMVNPVLQKFIKGWLNRVNAFPGDPVS